MEGSSPAIWTLGGTRLPLAQGHTEPGRVRGWQSRTHQQPSHYFSSTLGLRFGVWGHRSSMLHEQALSQRLLIFTPSQAY